jgi:hypothetical protein
LQRVSFTRQAFPITDSEAVSRMAGQLAEVTGPAGFYVYSIGFWAAVLASLLGVWQTVPHIFADCWELLRRRAPAPQDEHATRVPTSYTAALTFMALAAVPFAFVRRPLFLVVTFTILGSFFIPFLAATLLHLNNRVPWKSAVPHNRASRMSCWRLCCSSSRSSARSRFARCSSASFSSSALRLEHGAAAFRAAAEAGEFFLELLRAALGGHDLVVVEELFAGRMLRSA